MSHNLCSLIFSAPSDLVLRVCMDTFILDHLTRLIMNNRETTLLIVYISDVCIHTCLHSRGCPSAPHYPVVQISSGVITTRQSLLPSNIHDMTIDVLAIIFLLDICPFISVQYYLGKFKICIIRYRSLLLVLSFSLPFFPILI